MFFVKRINTQLILLVVLCFAPQCLFAQLQITEIMYDLDGTDSGREWVEVFNSSSQQINLVDYYLFENDVNHRIKSSLEDEIKLLNPGEYAVIADNTDKFLIDSPNFLEPLFDSAFSLSNNGETLSTVDSENNVLHTVTYSPDWGAKGTGNSLQHNGSEWIPGIPTPGKENVLDSEDENETEDSNTEKTNPEEGGDTADSQSAHSSDVDLTDYEKKTELKIGAGRKRYGLINTPIKFRSHKNLDTKNIDFKWSFGDTDYSNSNNPEHTYYNPGEYNVVLNARHQDEYAVSRTRAVIREPILKVEMKVRGKHVDILLINDSDFEVNLGGFLLILEINGEEIKRFQVATDTIFDSRTQIIISAEVTDFVLENSGQKTHWLEIFLRYPNGKLVAKSTLGNLRSKSVNSEKIRLIRSFIATDKIEDFDNLINDLNIK